MAIRILFAMLAVFAAVALAQNGRAEHREELTDQELLELHQAEAAERDALDSVAEVRERIRKSHGEDPTHLVEIYDGYVIRVNLGEEN